MGITNVLVEEALDDIEEMFIESEQRFREEPFTTMEALMKQEIYTDKEVQMFKILCQKFLYRLKEVENETTSV